MSSKEPVAEPVRVELLARELERYRSLAVIEPYLPAISGTLCVGATVALAAGDTNEVHVSKAALLAPTVGCSVMAFGSYALPRDYWTRVALSPLILAPSALLMTDVITLPDMPVAERFTMASFTGTGLAMGSLMLVDTLLERPVSFRTLAHDGATLRAEGTSLSRGQVARYEADLRRTDVRPIPRWAYGLTEMIGGVVSAAPAFFPDTERRDRQLAASFGFILLVPGTISFVSALVVPSGYERYTHELSSVQLSPLGPRGATGLWLSGTL